MKALLRLWHRYQVRRELAQFVAPAHVDHLLRRREDLVMDSHIQAANRRRTVEAFIVGQTKKISR